MPKHNRQQVKSALEILETEQIRERLKAKYYEVWTRLDPSEWDGLKHKLDLVDDLWAEIRAMGNERD